MGARKREKDKKTKQNKEKKKKEKEIGGVRRKTEMSACVRVCVLVNPLSMSVVRACESKCLFVRLPPVLRACGLGSNPANREVHLHDHVTTCDSAPFWRISRSCKWRRPASRDILASTRSLAIASKRRGQKDAV